MNINVENNNHDGQPAFLYHYTSIESLAAILSSKTMRLSQLTNVDDLQESKSDDAYNFARFVYVSSWTEDGVESIPMWKMYTCMSQGIRIKLGVVPFKEYDIKAEDIPAKQSVDSLSSASFKPIIPTKRLFSNEYLFMPYIKEGLLNKVEYTSRDEHLYPKILVEQNGKSTLNIGLLGLYKNTSWQFQREWRYKVWMAPGSLIEAMTYMEKFPGIVLDSVDTR